MREHLQAVPPEPGVGVFRGGLLGGRTMRVQGRKERAGRRGVAGEQPLFGHQAHIQRVSLARRELQHRASLRGAVKMAENGRLQSIGAEVERICVKRAVQEIKCTLEIAVSRSDLGKGVVRRRLPLLAPRRLVEGIAGFVGPALGFERDAQKIERLCVL